MVADLSPFSPAHCPRLVVKVGSSLLVNEEGAIKRNWLVTLVEDIATAHRAGQQIAIVSSGAIALGARRLKLPKGGRACLEDAQAAAATGQIALSQIWADLLAAHGVIAAQILVTLDDLEDRRRYLNASATLDRLMGLKVIPVINENDSVATAEIRFGDNDRLAARVAQAAGAQGVILLSDVDGLYTDNPGRNPDAQLIERVDKVDAAIMAMADGGTASGMGSGGMTSKLEAARIANAAGSTLAIVSGLHENPLSRFITTGRGTVFVPEKAARARKAWLAGRLSVKGTVQIDSGAAKALADGKSLLPAGATGVSGTFQRGDVINVLGADGTVIARGLAEYDSAESALIAGKRSDALAEVLGYAPRSALIHRDHLVIL
ncbi:glutamate 5-kinase [Sphingobium boeckii]|uniref:Glutamate 5-kinase n=1 Tax=Sphingobium boeckii TaxID=1082345 RepID=A0A7W9EF67_9SPHN|nr:glutamate 5-kinase [Sphingobium boeckii]MBB5685401.1 glutamate 5-kinase [Sphingobium boeckii]